MIIETSYNYFLSSFSFLISGKIPNTHSIHPLEIRLHTHIHILWSQILDQSRETQSSSSAAPVKQPIIESESMASDEPSQTMLPETPTSGANTITVVVLKNDAAASVAVENGKKRDTAVTLYPRSVNDTR